MSLYTTGENKWGYKVTIWSSTGRTTTHSGLSEGDPLLDQKAQATVLKALPTQALKAAVGGGMAVSAAFAAAGAAGSALGETISAVVMKGLREIMIKNAVQSLTQKGNCVGVTLAGDFVASYTIRSQDDVRSLPGFLAIVPAAFQEDGKPYWLGKDIIEFLVNDQLAACATGNNINIRYTIDV